MPSLQLGASCAAVVLLISVCRMDEALADEPLPTGNFLSTLKQAVQQDVDKEVVWGHFDVGTPPDAHRYYCLVNEKTGKKEEYGVAGELQPRRDGMTGLKGAAVSFYACSKAEAQGILVTAGYLLSPSVAAAAATPPAVAARAPEADAGNISAASETTTAGEVKAAFAKFIAAQNAHDRSAVADLLWDSRDFLVTHADGTFTRGRLGALDRYQQEWHDDITLTPPLNDVRIASPAPDVALLVSPLLVTQGGSAAPSATVMTWNGVFVKTHSSWRITSIAELRPTP